jgi:outer membrane lipoprotein-sorting protein
MAVGKHAQGARRDRSNENFKKKWSTLKKNGLNIHQTYDAEVYICIRRRGEKYEFKSTEKALPLSDEEKVRMCLSDRQIATNRARQNESFPLPVLVTAADVADERSDLKASTSRKERGRENDQECCVGNPPTGFEQNSPIDIVDT